MLASPDVAALLGALGRADLAPEDLVELARPVLERLGRDQGLRLADLGPTPTDPPTLAVSWEPAGAVPEGDLAVVLALVDQAWERRRAEARYDDLAARVDNAQQLADMGDYDWHIASDTNRWSDQLYRIYGHEPQSFNASYEKFLSLLHPEDRERITGVHQRAYATGEPYQMIERIVRPDGELRYLASNGQVIMDESGTPVRMRGTCIDITERVLAEQARERSAARFQALVESSPDAILVVAADGSVVQANGRADELLAGDVQGRPLVDLIPDGLDLGEPRELRDVAGRRLSGSELGLDLTVAPLADSDDAAIFLHDAAPRREREAMAARVREEEVRRRQALEINDNIVQGLSAAAYAAQIGDEASRQRYLDQTLLSARAMMNDLVRPVPGADVEPGSLVRAEAAAPGETETQTGPAGLAPSGAVKVLIVDDYDDVRMLLRLKLEAVGTYDVVGEAGDGEQGITLASELQPHLVLLDLSMPRKDGLEALPLIREAVPGVRVVVLSGFDQGLMAERALAAGADRYVEKGTNMDELMAVVRDVLQAS